MRQSTYNVWFLLSVLWLLVLIALVLYPNNPPAWTVGLQLTFYACGVNLIACVYIGLLPINTED